jgi:hypothetical protein
MLENQVKKDTEMISYFMKKGDKATAAKIN